MSKEYDLNFNDKYIGVEEPYKNDDGVVVFGKVDNCNALHLLYKSYETEHIDFFVELIKYVSDLEAKLAEKDEQLEYFSKRDEEQEKQLEKQAEFHRKNVAELKQQLAEKDVDLSLARNEIDTLKHNLNISQEHDNVMCEQYFEKCKKTNQDKISFCIEQLEKVKELLKYKIRNASCLLELGEYNCYVAGYENSIEAIDNQIEQLKEGK